MGNFEFTLSNNDTINSIDFQNKAEILVKEIISEVFSNSYEKSKVHTKHERLNFACPYCKDSATDERKKRGNIYKAGYSFHCYNCNTHVSFEEFLRDFGKSISGNEIIYVRNLQEQNRVEKSHSQFVDNSYFFNENILDTYAIDKDVIFNKYNLVNIKSPQGSWIKKYLTERHQLNFDTFAWDNELKRLYIFNLTKTNKVIGFQVRNFKSQPKYITHTLEMIYKYIGINYESTPEFLEINRLSFVFGLNTTDFTRPIIITEGPLDSFLIPNGMSVCGTNNDFPFDINNIRWMYDSDPPGVKKAMEKLSQGEYIFLWKKYIRDIGLDIYQTKIDYTDIIVMSKQQGKNTISLLEYFSCNKYDAYWL